VIQVKGVWKAYPGVQALKDVSLNIEPGTIHGIFGPNGAGKTTLLKVISGLTRADSGVVRVGEVDVTVNPEAARTLMGIQLELPAVYDELNLEQYLAFFGKLGGLRGTELARRVYNTMEVLEMTNLARSRVQKFSIGQLQRMEIGRAILNNPRILMLDEPFIALDYEFRRQLQDFLEAFVEQDRVVLITSHNLAEAKRFIHTYSLISRGSLTDGETARLTIKGHVYHMRTSDDETAERLLGTLEGVEEILHQHGQLRLTIEGPDRLPALFQKLSDNAIEPISLEAASDLEASYKELVHR